MMNFIVRMSFSYQLLLKVIKNDLITLINNDIKIELQKYKF